MDILAAICEVPEVLRFVLLPGQHWEYPNKRWMVIAFMAGSVFGMMFMTLMFVVLLHFNRGA